MNDPLKILIYEWLNTAEAKRDEALQNAFEKTKKQPKSMQTIADYFIEVARYQEFKEMQAVLYDLIK
jgi:hypothetical protein